MTVPEPGCSRVVLALLVSPLVAACGREPLPATCPAVGEGDLVVTELRGEQSGPDTRGQWLELHNASGATVDLRGLVVRMRPLDGADPARILVRADALPVDAEARVVLGVDTICTDDDCIVEPPPDVDYGFGYDFPRELFAEAIVEVEACGVIVDAVTYRSLPGEGTRAFDGTALPDATANDDAEGEAWCDDASMPDADGGPVTDLGAPGTPGEGNPPCP